MRRERSSQVEIAAANRSYAREEWDELVHAVDALTARAEKQSSTPVAFELCFEDSWRGMSGAPVAQLDYDDDAETTPGVPDEVMAAYRMIA